ncbi:hypothetical protein BH09PLA1_BH09PLA1_27930 [soil metagenome]
MRRSIIGSILLLLLVGGCNSHSIGGSGSVVRSTHSVGEKLDQFHAAAARADETAFFDCFAPDGVFIGTDATERWDLVAFRAFAHPYFAQGKGWTYKPTARHITIAPTGDVAWFDEMLHSDSYGTCRGSGVLRFINGQWKIAQYILSIPLPNSLAKSVVEMIRAENSK